MPDLRERRPAAKARRPTAPPPILESGGDEGVRADVGWGVVEMLGGSAVLDSPLNTSIDAHELLTEGLPTGALHHLVEHVALLQDGKRFNAALGMSARTHQRKKVGGPARLSREQSGRTWKFAEVLSKATDVFGSQRRAEDWMVQSARALDGRTPLELLATTAGTELVEDLLIRLDYGVYT